MKRVLYFAFWGGNEPLTIATVLPTVRALLSDGHASHVHLVTMERNGDTAFPHLQGIDGMEHSTVHAANGGPKALARLRDLFTVPRHLARKVREEKIDVLIARSSLAGASVRSVARRAGLPYIVESFEPHSQYMVQGGQWSRGGPFARMTARLERLQRSDADHLLPVTYNYARRLEEQGVRSDRMEVVPCPVDMDHFRFDARARADIRSRLGLTDEVVCAYAGKFGGLYHRELAYRAFARMDTYFGGHFRLILLTSEPRDVVEAEMKAAGMPMQRVYLGYATRAEMPGYLSAADLGFAPIRGTPSMAYCSPVKDGEYWATGLPVLLTRGVSDDSDIIERNEAAGALFDPEGDDLEQALDRIMVQLRAPEQREATRRIAMVHRSPDLLRGAYRKIFGRPPFTSAQ